MWRSRKKSSHYWRKNRLVTSEEPFSAPRAAASAGVVLPGEIAAEKHYRPASRSLARLRSIILLAAAFGMLVLVNAKFTQAAMLAAVGVIFLVLMSLRHRFRVPRWMKRNDAAVSRLGSGEIELASVELENLCHEARPAPLLHALFVFNRGVAYIHQGQPRRALQLFSAILQSAWTRSQQITNFHGMVLAESALALALIGELERAALFRRIAAEELDSAIGRLVFVDVLLALRRGEWKAAASIARSQFRAAESQRGGHGARALRVVWAFAASQLPSDGERSREMQRLLDGAYPYEPGELDYLAVEWPELAKFLIAHEFTAVL